MRIAMTGSTGFIGSRIRAALEAGGHELRLISRRARPGFFEWRSHEDPPPLEALRGADAVIHLAGEPVAQRWTPEVKQRIRDSRVRSTARLAEAMERLSPRPAVLVCASATGYYGNRGDEVLDETSAPGEGFLAETCLEWEKAAQAAEALGVRVVRLRFGMVLGREGGALKKMLPVFRLCLGGRLGSGQQWMPWIHIEDAAAMAVWALTEDGVSGPYNAVAPYPARNADFTRAMEGILGRPALFTVPEGMLRLALGEGAEIALASQRVAPRAALNAGFRFRYPALAEALRALLS
ncbi:MAG: TIGR01777 family oxidoreductase [Bryobacteraceae bacterium]|nr:TIGR01777 family oxidoreductase [Bryobacteraceae bacterium]MCX7603252.1 TIGR01777 family oxidoreductase [Bryobacteraceae bacterium]